MTTCSAVGCKSRPAKKIPGITFHSFPKDEQHKNEWIKLLGRKNWEPSKHSKLCSKHFTEDMIDRTSLSCVRLRPHAIPVILEGFPSHLEKGAIALPPEKKSAIVVQADSSQYDVANVAAAPAGATNSPNATYKTDSGATVQTLTPQMPVASQALSKNPTDSKAIVRTLTPQMTVASQALSKNAGGMNITYRLKEGQQLCCEQKYEEAASMFTDIIDILETDYQASKSVSYLSEAYNNLGFVQYKTVEFGKALVSFNKSIQLDNSFATPYYNQGTIYYRLGFYDTAAEKMTKAVMLQPTNTEFQEGLYASKMAQNQQLLNLKN